MYSTSTQKMHWTFATSEELREQRKQANEEYKLKMKPPKGSENDFLNIDDEADLLKIVTETGIRFGEDFTPKMWPAVKWTAFAYFKRFYLRHSPMEFVPKIIIVACYYLAMKVEEFNISIHDFTKNLRTGTPQTNAEQILHWEPILMHRLNYHLTVHSPYRPFEGHLMEMKTHGMLGFDLEAIRPHTDNFFRKCLFGDVMLLYPPTHIALAALSYGLNKLGEFSEVGSVLAVPGKMKGIFREHILRLCQVDSWKPSIENATIADKLLLRVDQICSLVESQAQVVSPENKAKLQEKTGKFQALYERLTQTTRSLVPTESEEDQN